jgi:short subunit dehydrogenase-like uncharacterized protein
MHADITDEESLLELARSCRVLINCAGPFRFLGEPVVKACVAAGTHFIDSSGEPAYIEGMELRYFAEAEARGVLVVSACGLDSIPADLGTWWTQQAMAGAGAVARSVETVLTVSNVNGAHATTFECAVHGFGDVKSLRALRKDLKAARPVEVPRYGPKLRRRRPGLWDVIMGRYILPFPGSDASIVRRSQAQFARERAAGGDAPTPVQIGCYFGLRRRWVVWATMVCGAVLGVLANYAWGRRLLIRYPSFFTLGAFTHAGPTQDELANGGFAMDFFAKGVKGSDPTAEEEEWTMHTRMEGPEPGYIATSRMLASAAETLANERESIPLAGGVFTTAAVFRHTTLMQQLQEQGITMSIIKPAGV